MNFSLVVAIAENNIIGGNNKLLWHLPADMRYFRLLTTNNIVIMGRKTFDSIGKPLPNRTNIVISRNERQYDEGILKVDSLEKALEKAEILRKTDQQIFVIGGAQIYQMALANAQNLYVTEVKASFDGDTFFPKIDKDIWHEASREKHLKDEKNNFNYEFVVYNRVI